MKEEKKELLPVAAEESVPHIQREDAGETVTCEASGEYTLPDYQPEIRKILSIRAAVLPSGKYLGGMRAEFAGTVAHSVLYADAEGKLASVTLNSDYDFSLPLPEEGGYVAMADSMAEATVCRLGGPRKISLRTRVRSLVHLLREEALGPEIRGMGSPEDKSSLELLTEERESMRLACGSSGEFVVSGNVRLDHNGQQTRAVWAGGGLLLNECRAQEGGCLCRGEIWVRALCTDGEGTPYTVREKLPFEEFVAIEGAGERASCFGFGRVISADVSVAPGEGEEPGTLSFDVSAEVEACAVGTQSCRPVRDLYSTSYDMRCRYRELSLMRPLGTVMGHYTVSGSRARGECEAEDAVSVVDTDGRMEIDTVSTEHGRAVVCGKLITQMIFSTAAGEQNTPTLLSAEIPIPFRIETELRPAFGTRPQFICHGELIGARGRIEQNALAVDAEISLALRAYEEERIRTLEDAEPDRSIPVEHRGNRIFVYYPKDEDTLFGVAAHYHKSRSAVAAHNGLGEGAVAASHLTASLDGVHHLLIED